MKKIIAICAILSSTFSFAQTRPDLANTRLEMLNNAGGKIVLKFSICEINGEVFNKAFSVYSYAASGNTATGCWIYQDKKVMVFWSDGKQSIFEPTQFDIIKD